MNNLLVVLQLASGKTRTKPPDLADVVTSALNLTGLVGTDSHLLSGVSAEQGLQRSDAPLWFHAGVWSSSYRAFLEGNHRDSAHRICSRQVLCMTLSLSAPSVWATRLDYHSSASFLKCSGGSSVLCTEVCLDLPTGLALLLQGADGLCPLSRRCRPYEDCCGSRCCVRALSIQRLWYFW